MKKIPELKPLQRSHGFSIVSVVVATGILGILITVGASFFVRTIKQQKRMESQFEKVELKYLLSTVLNRTDSCENLLVGEVLDLTGVTTTTPSSGSNNLGVIRLSTDPTSPIVVESNQNLPASNTSLKAGQMVFKNLLSTGAPDQYIGTIFVPIGPVTDDFILSPLELPQLIAVDGTAPVNARPITNCLSGGGSGGGFSGCHIVSDQGPGPGYFSQANCPGGEIAVTGGGRCSNNHPGSGFTSPVHPPATAGFVQESFPVPEPPATGPPTGWHIDCALEGGTGEVASEAFAVCCPS